MAYNSTGTSGNDQLNHINDIGPGTIVGLAGSDCILPGSGVATVSGDSGNDTIVLVRPDHAGTINGGTDNDSIFADSATGSLVLLGGNGSDSINMANTTAGQTILGGNNSTDEADSITGSRGSDLVFGHGGTTRSTVMTETTP